MKISQNDEEIQGSLQKEPPQLSNNLKYPNVNVFYRNGNVAAANAFLWTFCVMAGLIARMVLMKQSQVFVACPWKSDWQRGTMQHRAELKSGKSKTHVAERLNFVHGICIIESLGTKAFGEQFAMTISERKKVQSSVVCLASRARPSFIPRLPSIRAADPSGSRT